MKAKLKCLFLLLTVMAALCGCGQSQTASTQVSGQNDMTEVQRSAFGYSLPPIEETHGADYAIEWKDSGMEANIRFLLNKPEGDILHSDVWDIQVLAIWKAAGYGVLLEQPAEGWEEFTFQSIFWNKDLRHSYDNLQFPKIENLSDLVHFDSLQLLSTVFPENDPQITDISGLTSCENLKVLELTGTRPETLTPLANLSGLEKLGLEQCGTLDLTPIEDLPNLSVVSLYGSHILSLEPLTKLPKLQALDLAWEATYPSLEPLTRTSLEYLNMSLSVDGRNLYDDLDYEPLTRIPNLVYLDLINHTRLNVSLCSAILEGNPNLKYLDISYTPAADHASELNTKNLIAFVAEPSKN